MRGITEATLLLLGCCVGAAAQSQPAVSCAEVFVQDFVHDDGGLVFRDFTPCPGDDLQGLPAYPVQQTTVHKEYSHGDWYVVQVASTWQWEPSGREDCVHVNRRIVRNYRRVEGAADESVRVGPDGIERSRDGVSLKGAFIAGGGPKARVPRDALGTRRESTRFGIECVRLVQPIPGIGDGCLPILPVPKCRAELHLMPIEILVSLEGGGRLTSRTTRLDVLPNDTRLDRSAWSMP